MRIACIGDLHGVDRWKEVRDLQVDHIVFVGDYADSYELSDEVILKNLLEVIAFKQEAPEAVSLLLGNHDIHYRYYPDFRGTGFRESMQVELQDIYKEHDLLFDVSRAFGSYIFTHAGLSRNWTSEHVGKSLSATQLSNNLNNMRKDESDLYNLAKVGIMRGGSHGHGGPFWCDYHKELVVDPYPGISQIVGHTKSTFLIRKEVGGSTLVNVNYLAYSDGPIYILEIESEV